MYGFNWIAIALDKQREMMNGSEINPKDLDLINSFVDQELSDDELLIFTDRLTSVPAMRQEINEIAALKTLLSKTPEKRPPRNYTLTRIEARQFRKPSLWERIQPMFRGAALVCAILLAFSFVFPLMGNLQPASSPALISKSLDAIPTEEMSQSLVVDVSRSYSTANKEIALESAAPSMSADMNDFTDPSQPNIILASSPSHGVRGGTPKNEFLLSTKREIPSDMTFNSIVESAFQNGETALEDSKRTEDVSFFSIPADPQLGKSAPASLSVTQESPNWLIIARTVLFMLILFSLFFIAMNRGRKKQAR